MSLIYCYECGKKISVNAASCPHCGAPGHAPDAYREGASKGDKPGIKKKPGSWLRLFWATVAILATLAIALPAYQDYMAMSSQGTSRVIAESDPNEIDQTPPAKKQSSTPQKAAPTGEPTTNRVLDKETVKAGEDIEFYYVNCRMKTERTSRTFLGHAYSEIERRKPISDYYKSKDVANRDIAKLQGIIDVRWNFPNEDKSIRACFWSRFNTLEDAEKDITYRRDQGDAVRVFSLR